MQVAPLEPKVDLSGPKVCVRFPTQFSPFLGSAGSAPTTLPPISSTVRDNDATNPANPYYSTATSTSTALPSSQPMTPPLSTHNPIRSTPPTQPPSTPQPRKQTIFEMLNASNANPTKDDAYSPFAVPNNIHRHHARSQSIPNPPSLSRLGTLLDLKRNALGLDRASATTATTTTTTLGVPPVSPPPPPPPVPPPIIPPRPTGSVISTDQARLRPPYGGPMTPPPPQTAHPSFSSRSFSVSPLTPPHPVAAAVSRSAPTTPSAWMKKKPSSTSSSSYSSSSSSSSSGFKSQDELIKSIKSGYSKIRKTPKATKTEIRYSPYTRAPPPLSDPSTTTTSSTSTSTSTNTNTTYHHHHQATTGPLPPIHLPPTSSMLLSPRRIAAPSPPTPTMSFPPTAAPPPPPPSPMSTAATPAPPSPMATTPLLGRVTMSDTESLEESYESDSSSNVSVTENEDSASTPTVAASASKNGNNKKKGKKHAINTGVWTNDEHNQFLIGLYHCGRGNWRVIAHDYVKTRSRIQVASHAQKYFQKMTKATEQQQQQILEQQVKQIKAGYSVPDSPALFSSSSGPAPSNSLGGGSGGGGGSVSVSFSAPSTPTSSHSPIPPHHHQQQLQQHQVWTHQQNQAMQSRQQRLP